MVSIGVGIIIVNNEGRILLKKRMNAHAPYYSIPGGSLDPGETFEECAVREVEEETNLKIKNPRVIALTNDLQTYQEEGKHDVAVGLLVDEFEGELKNMEPEKCEELIWADPRNLPQPHFNASAQCVECYLKDKFYIC